MNIYRIFDKILRPFCTRILCRKQPDTNEPEKLTKVKIGAFNYSIGIHHNDFTEKSFRQEEEKFCEVSQDTDALFVHTIKFLCIW